MTSYVRGFHLNGIIKVLFCIQSRSSIQTYCTRKLQYNAPACCHNTHQLRFKCSSESSWQPNWEPMELGTNFQIWTRHLSCMTSVHSLRLSYFSLKSYIALAGSYKGYRRGVSYAGQFTDKINFGDFNCCSQISLMRLSLSISYFKISQWPEIG